MDYLSLSLPEYEKRFSTEEACLDAIFEARWPNGFVCPRCGHDDGYRLSTRRVVQCASCRRQASITAGTIFHRTRVPLTYWFKAIYHVAQDKGGISALKLSNQLATRYETILKLLRKLRLAMGNREKNLTLAGYIEIDEAFFGGKLKDMEEGESAVSNKEQVLILVESEGKHAGNLVMKVVPGGTWDDLKPVFDTSIEQDPSKNSFRTDGLQAHSALIGLGKLNMTPIPDDLLDLELPTVSTVITLAKRFLLGTYHHYCKQNLQLFLDEFCYRWNRRGRNREQWSQIAHRLIKACSLYSPPELLGLRIPQAHLDAFTA